jgi:hypothetical protein
VKITTPSGGTSLPITGGVLTTGYVNGKSPKGFLHPGFLHQTDTDRKFYIQSSGKYVCMLTVGSSIKDTTFNCAVTRSPVHE